MPTREEATVRETDDEICDLDIVLSRRAFFILGGRKRVIEPITTERLFAFWQAGQDFKKGKYENALATNTAYFKIIQTVCEDFTLEDAVYMSVIQKANLLEHIARKVTGEKNLTDTLKKKVVSPDQDKSA